MISDFNEPGLTDKQVFASREKYGYNRLNAKKHYYFLESIVSLAKEPMVILLIVTSSVYFIVGKTGDGIFMASAILLVSAISLYQESRSRNALTKLKSLTQPNAKVIRNGSIAEIKSEELVVGDYLVAEEGTSVSADGIIVHANDFSVNESILTGESLTVYKNGSGPDNKIFAGTNVVSGLAIAVISETANETRLGKIGKSLENIKEEKTPLEIKINDFVKKMVIGGAVVFVFVWVVNYLGTRQLIDSILKALTLAMSILPEEIPVAFTTFMALGAWRLMKMGILAKKIKTVETLGSATVICTDKTGTITENKMTLASFFTLDTDKISTLKDKLTGSENELITLAMWASEPIPFDPMEIALHNAYAAVMADDERLSFKLIHEYPLGGIPPMMTHVFEDNTGRRIIAAKGAPEALLNVSKLSVEEQQRVEEVIITLASKGYRLLGVAETSYVGNDFRDKQEQYQFHFKGIVAFYDPPKENIPSVLQQFYEAGIAVKIVTGDNAATTHAIAKQVGFKGLDANISGDELMKLPDAEIQEVVSKINIFTRMFPEAKLKVINALKANNEIVAMTGDGINDGPALKAAHIGIAMGKKGTEIAKQAASLILLEDDLSKMLDAVAMGRRIYANLKKAIQYIISIHIPIILTVVLPLALRWVYPNIFSPVHIIFLELIMGPTCSIIFENEPMEKNTMLQNPRPFSTAFFSWHELTISIIQGIAITLGTLSVYQYAVHQSFNEPITRTMVFTVLISANIFLTLVNRSFYFSIFTTMKYKNILLVLIVGITVTISGLLLFIKPLTIFFEFETLNLIQLSISIGIGFLSVIWLEIAKWIMRMKHLTHINRM
jgi:Ca2+-transporting ATPase